MTLQSPLRRTLTRTFAIVSALLLTATAHAETLEEARERLAAGFDIIEPQHVDVSPVPGWYQIQKGSIIAYISDDGRYLLQGDLIDLDAQINLSSIARDEGRRDMMAQLSDDEVITFAPQEIRHTVTVFTDIGCTYCRRLHNQIEEYMAHGIAVRYVLYPRNGRASRDWNTSEDVWCATDRNHALTAAKLDRSFDTESCDSTMIEEHYALGQEVGLSGTPAIVLEDGTLIGGYMPPEQLALRLEQQTASAAR
ncbi:MAG: DsbC family protein [Woeseiaceae bacterium]|nr:DsbC family protein [Woeseiaceae bacterium]